MMHRPIAETPVTLIFSFVSSHGRLTPGDPHSQGQTVGKAKRVRSVLTWAMEHSYENGCGFVDQLVSLVRTCGGFRGESPNYVGEEAIKSLRDAMHRRGLF